MSKSLQHKGAGSLKEDIFIAVSFLVKRADDLDKNFIWQFQTQKKFQATNYSNLICCKAGNLGKIS